jgi:hypothetical protein
MAEPSFATCEELVRNPAVQRPHVVILGAGASVASCPAGDKNGRRLPTMDNFVNLLGFVIYSQKMGLQMHMKTLRLCIALCIQIPCDQA